MLVRSGLGWLKMLCEVASVEVPLWQPNQVDGAAEVEGGGEGEDGDDDDEGAYDDVPQEPTAVGGDGGVPGEARSRLVGTISFVLGSVV